MNSRLLSNRSCLDHASRYDYERCFLFQHLLFDDVSAFNYGRILTWRQARKLDVFGKRQMKYGSVAGSVSW